MTVKGITVGATRLEYEYEIPVADANEMLDGLCEQPIVEKDATRSPMRGSPGRSTSSPASMPG